MPTPGNIVLVLIASPGDAMEERATVRDSLNDWSVTSGAHQGVVLLPWLYERHAVARLGDRAQALINSQAVDRSDIVVAFFDSRLGTSTGVDVSGTAEEIHRAASQGKPVHVYFSQEAIPRSVDVDQLAALKAFKSTLTEEGLLGEYANPVNLAHQVMRAIESDIHDKGWGELSTSDRSSARLTWEHVKEREEAGLDRSGATQYRTTRNELVVHNHSDIDADDMVFKLSAPKASEDSAYFFEAPDGPVTVYAHSERNWRLVPTRPGTLQVDATWTERGLPRRQTRTFRIS